MNTSCIPGDAHYPELIDSQCSYTFLGDLTVDGDVELGNSLEVMGNLTVGGNCTVRHLFCQGNLKISGQTTIAKGLLSNYETSDDEKIGGTD